MGKNLREKVTCSPIQNHPGFMWGLFDILKHNHWRYIKKRLPHKRPLCRKNVAGTKNEVNNMVSAQPDDVPISKSKVEDITNVDSRQRPKKPSKESISGEKTKKDKHNIEEKSRRTHSEIKRSVKALIKVLVIEDKSKRKSRHHRSCTYPVQPNPKEKDSLSEVESSDKNSSSGDDRIRVGISPTVGSLNPLYLMSEESSNSDSEDLRLQNVPDDTTTDENNRNDYKNEKSDDDDYEEEAWLDPKLRDNTKEGYSENEDDTSSSSPRRSKECLDALNLIHMNRNFLLKVLQDPGSPLARHFQSQQAFSSKTMTKAGSFPTHGGNREDHNPISPSIGGIQKLNEAISKLADNKEDSSGSAYTRKRGKNQVVIKRFKDLRQKIKHVINENKNEKHRITMDAVLDKVPRNHGFSKDLRQDILAHLKGNSVTKNNKSEGGSAKLKQIRRTSSLCGSLDRYLQLYECSFQREVKNNNKSVLATKGVPKVLGRILSSPEMKSPYAFKLEDLPSPFAISKRSLEQEDDNVLEDILEDHHSMTSEHEMLETTEDSSCCDSEKFTSMAETQQETSSFDENASESFILQENVEEAEEDMEEEEEELHIEAQDKVKFNYVRDVLEISGFNAPESLSMWQLDYQPLDPLVYEEVTSTTTTTKGCMIQDPDCSRNEEGEEGDNCCNHVVLFDLINEVLIEIYERSYHYCPKPLSSLCRVHPMPLGYSVLKEVWVRISGYLRYKAHGEDSFDKIMIRDLSRDDGWMDLQFESECVGIEVEDLIFEELLEELLVLF